jgi:hypothetical protein
MLFAVSAGLDKAIALQYIESIFQPEAILACSGYLFTGGGLSLEGNSEFHGLLVAPVEEKGSSQGVRIYGGVCEFPTEEAARFSGASYTIQFSLSDIASAGRVSRQPMLYALNLGIQASGKKAGYTRVSSISWNGKDQFTARVSVE